MGDPGLATPALKHGAKKNPYFFHEWRPQAVVSATQAPVPAEHQDLIGQGRACGFPKETEMDSHENCLRFDWAFQRKSKMAEKKSLNDLIQRSANRRAFVKKLGLAGAAIGAAAATKGLAQTTTFTDAQILNFTLNLAFLEAEFYTVATTGMTLSQYGGVAISGAGTLSGAVTGGSQVAFAANTSLNSVALELAANERARIAVLQTAIGAQNVATISEPAINLNALGFGFGSVSDFLKLARIFEDIGVSAYAGATTTLQSAANIGIAARILATEAEHAGNIRLQIAQAGTSTFPPLDAADHLPPPSGIGYFSTDSRALVETRTPQQVLALLYGAVGVNSGGFFPTGAGGAIFTSASATATTDGAYITASPNPIIVASGDGVSTISWSAPGTPAVQVRVGSPTGPVLAYSGPTGSAQTGSWITDGTVFYLQTANTGDGSPGTPLASVVVHLVP